MAKLTTDSESEGGDPTKSVIVLSSSDDDDVIAISSASSEDIKVNFATSSVEEKEKMREGCKELAVDKICKVEETVVLADSMVTAVNDVSDSVVLRKLLRGPRYFDPGERNSKACFNCDEEGHTAINCTKERRKKPCFVCGMFGHSARRCLQGQGCFVCKRRGHIARNCPDKHNHTPQESMICLRCGEVGHDMVSCKNDYAPDDLKEIQCYVCKNYGHLCCVEVADTRKISCFNCAQSDHTGQECANKLHGEMIGLASPTLCYKCGEEGHFARRCPKYLKVRSKARHLEFDRWDAGSSTPQRFDSESKSSSKKKKKRLHDVDRWNMTTGKSRRRGGWIEDDPGEFSPRKHKNNSHASSATRQYATSQSPYKKQKSFLGTPNSNGSASCHYHEYSAPRYGK